MSFNRELSQFASSIELDPNETYVSIATSDSTNLGIGTTDPSSKLTVFGDTLVTGVTTSIGGFSGDLTGNVTGDLVGNVTGILTGDVYGNVIGNITGIASTAYTLATPRNFSISGTDGAASSVAFDGTADVDLVFNLTNTGVSAGTYGSAGTIPTFTVDAKGRLTAAGEQPVSTGLTVAGDTGSDTINLLTDVFTIAGGTNVTSVATTDTVTMNLNQSINLTSVNASGIITAGTLSASDGVNNITITGTQVGSSGSITVNSPSLYVTGNLQVDGTQTVIESTTVEIVDKNILLAKDAPNDAAADGGGFTVESIAGGNKTFQYDSAGQNFTSSENLDLAVDKVYKINNTLVLASNTLGSGIVTSSLQQVGTLDNLQVTGVTTSLGGFVGDISGNAGTATSLATARDFTISGDGTAPAVSFDGTADVDLVLTLANTGVTAATYGSANAIPILTVDAKGRLTSASEVVVATGLTVAADSGTDQTIDLLTETLTIAGGTNVNTSAANDTITVGLNSSISLNSINATGIITASEFYGDLTGNVYAASGISTFNDIEINSNIYDINNSAGTAGQILINVGTGISWRDYNDEIRETRTSQLFSAGAGQTGFAFDYNVDYIDVFVNGVKLSETEFTAINGIEVVLDTPAGGGDSVELISYNTASVGVGSVSVLNDLTDVNITSLESGQLLNYNGSQWVNTPNAKISSNNDLLLTSGSGFSSYNGRGGRLNLEVTTGFSDARMQIISNFNASGDEGSLILGKTRGTTLGSNTAVVDGDILGKIFFQGADGSNLQQAAVISSEVDGAVSTGVMPGRLMFYTTPSGSSTPVERMRIDSNGNVKIGYAINVNPWDAVTGTTQPGTFIGGQNGAFGLAVNSSTIPMIVNQTQSSGTLIEFKVAGNVVGSITGTTSGVSYNTSSDYRLKENVTAIDGVSAVERVKQLKPSNFSWKSDASAEVVDGFIAHELQEVVEDAVSGTKDEVDAEGNPVYQSIDTARLVPLLTAALKEAIAKVDALEAKIAQLEGN